MTIYQERSVVCQKHPYPCNSNSSKQEPGLTSLSINNYYTLPLKPIPNTLLIIKMAGSQNRSFHMQKQKTVYDNRRFKIKSTLSIDPWLISSIMAMIISANSSGDLFIIFSLVSGLMTLGKSI